MVETRLFQKSLSISEANLRIELETKGLKRLQMTKETKALLNDYVFGNGENPFNDLNKKRDQKLQKLEDEFQTVLVSASKI